MPDPVVNNLATSRISEGRNAPTGSKFSRNLCVLNAFKFQTSIFCEYNFSGNSGLCVEKCHPVYASYYITNLCQQRVWWRRLLFLPLHRGIVLQYLDLRNEFKVETSLFLVKIFLKLRLFHSSCCYTLVDFYIGIISTLAESIKIRLLVENP